MPYLPTTSFFFFFLFSSELLVVLETSGRPPSKPHVVLRAQPAARYPRCHNTLECSCVEIGQPLSSLWLAICVTPHGPLVSTPDWLLSTGSGQTLHGGGVHWSTRQSAGLCGAQRGTAARHKVQVLYFTCWLGELPLRSADSDVEINACCLCCVGTGSKSGGASVTSKP